MKMERNEHIIPPGTITYEITDDTGHTIILSPERAHDVLNWLYNHREELHQGATSIPVNPLDVFLVVGDLDAPFTDDTPECKDY